MSCEDCEFKKVQTWIGLYGSERLKFIARKETCKSADKLSLEMAIIIKDKILTKLLYDKELFNRVWNINKASEIIERFHCFYISEPNNIYDYKLKIEKCLKKDI